MIALARVRNLSTPPPPVFPEPDLRPDKSVRRLNLNESPVPPSPRVIKARSAPWMVTRTFSKAYSLAGLRVGYAYAGDPQTGALLWKLRANFNVARTGLAAACAAFDDAAYSVAIVDLIIGERTRLAEGLRRLGCEVYPSSTNFITIRTLRPAAVMSKSLAAGGILVQVLPWPDQTGSLRITVGNQGDTDAVLAAMTDAVTREHGDD